MFNYFDDIFNLYWDKDDNFLLNSKKNRTRDIVLYMLNRTQQIFEWDGLPDTIPAHNLETLLQLYGNACITEVDNIPKGHGDKGLYAFFGGLGGELNAYYEPTLYTVANPYLAFSDNLKIGVDCVRARNDKYGVGLLPMFSKYGAMMNENEITMNMLDICYRIDNLISADNDKTYESAKQYLDDIISGQFGVISSNEFFDGIRNDKVSGGKASIKDLIEYQQYIKASWYNEIGLNSNYNMKRERMVASESEMNDDALIPLVDNMLEWRQTAIDEIKEMYGDRYNLDGLRVTLNPIWDLDKMYVDMIPEDRDDTTEGIIEETPEEITEESEETIDETPEEITEESEDIIEETPEETIEETEDTIEETPEETTEELEDTIEEISERLENIDEKLDDIIKEVSDDEETEID